ncbi:MAG: arginyltransferase [Pirellulaceae bacterium]|jgi:arginine-tRNA-protein transferase|nr:arginyltransferase [Pirellulaceae bacterium]
MHPFQSIVVSDSLHDCPYLDDRIARTPLHLPIDRLTPQQFDAFLAVGGRRSGAFLYQTECPVCSACEPIRVPVSTFQPTRSQRRVFRRGESDLHVEIGEPEVDRRRVELFNRHKQLRSLATREGAYSADDYARFLVDGCCRSVEIRYWLGDQLAAVAIADQGDDSLSAVYCYFEPQLQRYSLGVYSILKQIELSQQWSQTWVYLGLYIADSKHMAYKNQYYPHERFIGGAWVEFSEQ